LYLLYLRSGFIKKFPLDKETVFLGRARDNDFSLDETFVSKRHAKLTVFKDHIIIEDIDSTNGVFVESTRISKADVKLNQCFRIGYITFFLKKGNAREFVLSEKVRPVLNRISNVLSAGSDETQAAISLLYSESLIEMLQIGFKLQESIDLFKDAAALLNRTLKKGCLLLLSGKSKSVKIESEWNYGEKYHPLVNRVLSLRSFFHKPITRDNITAADGFYFCSFPITLTGKNLVLLYIVQSADPISETVKRFLEDLSVEVSLIGTLIEQDRPGSGAAGSGKEDTHAPEIITTNQEMVNLLSKCEKIAASDLFVVIEGETGTGKELFAKFIHSRSGRSKGNFVPLNCAAIPENLMEVELFGNEKGAFTDAKERRIGKLELSSGGTLVLDEIGDMPVSLQKKLLRAIQERQFFRIGGNQPILVDLRIICLTHKNIKDLLNREQFREDLYYRLAHVSLKVPSLKDRQEDIIPLINHFVEVFSDEYRIYIRGFSNESIKALETYDWPGNIRELENEIKKVIAISEDGDMVDLELLKDEIADFYKERLPVITGSGESEREQILDLLEKYNWNRTRVSKELNISRPTLYDKLRKYNIN
ncbi:MAG: FHA domain-containing protein, partial [bacterium]|nr:FHA domain-containing protein [bacterium]